MKPRKTQNKHRSIDLYPKPMQAKPRTTNLQAATAVTFSLQASAVSFIAVITLAERVRSRGRDRGLERFDGDCGIAQREEKRIFFFFFLISGDEKLVYKDLFGFS